MNSSNETNEIDKIFSSVKPNKDEREHAHSKQQHPSQGNNLKMSNSIIYHNILSFRLYYAWKITIFN